jgi:hypothetical protein
MSGFAQFAKPIILNEMIKSIQDRINKLACRYDLFQSFIPVLKKFEGKKISKRIETALKEAFPKYNINLHEIANMVYIYIWGNGIEYGNRESFFVCYLESEQGLYHEDSFVNKHNGDIGNILECISKLKQGLIEAPKLVERYNKLLKEAQVLVDDAEKVGQEYDYDIICRNRNN